MAGVNIGTGTGSSSELVIDTSGNAQVKLPTHATPANAGSVRAVSENDAGSVTGTALLKAPETTDDYKLRAGLDTILEAETFCYAAQNTAKHIYRNTTMTNAWGSGFMTTNSGSITSTTTGTLFQTYRSFPLFGASAIYCDMNGAFSLTAGPANCTIDFGFFQAGTSTPYAPTDGAFFRLTSTGLQGVTNYNGAETTVALTFTIAANRVYYFTVSLTERNALFWIDGVLYGTITMTSTLAQPLMAQSVPLSVRQGHAGIAASAIQFKLAEYTVSMSDWHTARPWSETMVGMGNMGSQGQSGGTMGSTALYTNNLAPGAGVAPTNTTAALGSGLGGQFSALPTLAANTDGIISSYLVPAATVASGGRNLVIRGVKIDGIVTTALTGGPVYYLWSLAYGHNLVALTTAEAATTKAPRRIPLGIQTYVVTAAVGTLGQTVTFTFANPIVVQPGEFVQTVAKNVGTVTTLGVITCLVSFDAFWE